MSWHHKEMSSIEAGGDAQSKESDLWFFNTKMITELASVDEIIQKNQTLEKGKR